MLGWVTQYGVSSQFHRRQWGLAEEQFLSDLDHVGILAMVAASYCPLVMLLSDRARAAMSAVLVGAVLLGARHAFVKRGGRAAETVVAIGMVLSVAPAASELFRLCTAHEWRLHCCALLQYGVGGLAYAGHWPEPLPGVFGSQEVMHLLTCTGSLATLAMASSICARL
ncbi:hypothetical protein T492DRAFT_1083212 [Pavlovales sp. CCMP2436]|nr:hypothetical protein T492DRAFT_1083212 [Pavlovales sp. CCMP2436]